MKKTTSKLSLSRETLRRIDAQGLGSVHGGAKTKIGRSDLCSQWTCLAASCGCPTYGCPVETL